MKMIQGILRHGALSTTERYVERLSEDLRGTVEMLATVEGDGGVIVTPIKGEKGI